MRYNWFWYLESSWSWYEGAKDCSMPYPVVEYTHFASNIDEFIQKYPRMSIDQCNKALSKSTFGDVGTGCRSYNFETIYFNNTDYYYKPIITEHSIESGYNIGVEIGLNFKKEGNILRLKLCCDGFIISHGAYSRTLEFGLSATSVTFYPDWFTDINGNSIDDEK